MASNYSDTIASNKTKIRNALKALSDKRKTSLIQLQSELLTEAKSKPSSEKQNIHKKNLADKEMPERQTLRSSLMDAISKMDKIHQSLKSRRDKLRKDNRHLKETLKEKGAAAQFKKYQINLFDERKAYCKSIIRLNKSKLKNKRVTAKSKVWDQCIYDTFWLKSSSIWPYFNYIMKLESMGISYCGEMREFTRDFLLKTPVQQIDCTKKAIYKTILYLILVAKACLDNDRLMDAGYYCEQAINIAATNLMFSDYVFAGKCILCMSLLLLKSDRDRGQLFKYLNRAFDLFNNRWVKNETGQTRILIADNYIEFLHIIFNQPELAIMEINNFESGIKVICSYLHKTENKLVASTLNLARLCNDNNFCDDSLVVYERLMKYYEDNNKSMLKNTETNILEIAEEAEENLGEISEETLSMTVEIPSYFHEAPIHYLEILMESAVSMTKSNYLAGSQILYRLLKEKRSKDTNTSRNSSNKSKLQLLPIKLYNYKMNPTNHQNLLELFELSKDIYKKNTNFVKDSFCKHSKQTKQLLPLKLTNVLKPSKMDSTINSFYGGYGDNELNKENLTQNEL